MRQQTGFIFYQAGRSRVDEARTKLLEDLGEKVLEYLEKVIE